MRLACPARHKPPDDLKGGEGFAGAGGHDQQDAILPAGNGVDGALDGHSLVIARRFAVTFVEIILADYRFLLRRDAVCLL